MASITTLPTELLLQIFKTKDLTSTDLARCAQTCRRLRDITYSKDFTIDYIFQVDHPSQSGWRLIRCLLLNPALGERIRTLKITWHRRRRRDKSTWTLKWNWTDDELSQIFSLGKKWHLNELVGGPISSQNTLLYPAIKIGLNSETLLPLLLCYTPNLESLDIGDVAPDMISDEYGHTILDAIRISTHCMGLTDEGPQTGDKETSPEHNDVDKIHLQSWYKSGGALYTSRGRLREPFTNTPWIYSTFNRDSWVAKGEGLNLVSRDHPWLPGLSNIKEFSHGGSNSGSLRYRPRSLNTWPNTNLSKVLQLPRLETLKLIHINALTGTPMSAGETKPSHSLKRLEIFHYRFYRSDFETVAALTGGSLESVECILSDENFSPWDMSPEKKIAIITDTFQENSKETLARDRISVTRSFKPFFDDFEYESREARALLAELPPMRTKSRRYHEYRYGPQSEVDYLTDSSEDYLTDSEGEE